MKKSDLKSGMVVEYRNGDKRLVVNDDLIGDNGSLSLTYYTVDLKYNGRNRDFDITKIYRYKKNRIFSRLLNDDNLELILERKNELTSHEIDVLKALQTLGFNWIARDRNNNLYAYNDKPHKFDYQWNTGGIVISLKHLTVGFDFIKWSDEEPTNIDELLKEVEK